MSGGCKGQGYKAGRQVGEKENVGGSASEYVLEDCILWVECGLVLRGIAHETLLACNTQARQCLVAVDFCLMLPARCRVTLQFLYTITCNPPKHRLERRLLPEAKSVTRLAPFRRNPNPHPP